MSSLSRRNIRVRYYKKKQAEKKKCRHLREVGMDGTLKCMDCGRVREFLG